MYVQMEQIFGRTEVKLKDQATGQCFEFRELPPEEDGQLEDSLVAAVMQDVRERSVRTQQHWQFYYSLSI